MSRRTRLILINVRGLMLAVLVLLVARPALVADGEGWRPRGVALLVDNSTSMQQVDRRVTSIDLLRVAIAKGSARPDINPDAYAWHPTAREQAIQSTRLSLARSALSNPEIGLISEFRQSGAFQAYLFGGKARQVDYRNMDHAMTADEERTALFDSLRDVATAPGGDPPGAIVVISDGVDNASVLSLEESISELKKLDIAVYVYGVGSTDSGAVRLIDAAIPETIFVDDVVGIPIRWRYRGAEKTKAIIGVRMNGAEVGEKEIVLTPGEGKDSISCTPASKPGGPLTANLAVTIRLKSETQIADEVLQSVTLSERKVRVLVIEETPRWEFKFLQPVLSRDRRVEATYLIAQGDPRALGNEPFLPSFPSRDKLFGFDLVIVGDVAPATLGPSGMNSLVDYVREGGGLAVIAGRKHMPADYADSPLAEILPVEFLTARFPPFIEKRSAPFQSQLTPSGRRSSVMMLADVTSESEAIWNELPGLFWHYPVTKLRPGAVALLAYPRQNSDDAPQPIIATHFYGKGPVMFLGTDETWRWRYNSEDRIYSRFWGQIVYQLGLPHLLGQSSRVHLELDRSDAVVGKMGYIYARMFDTDYRPYLADRVPAVLEPIEPPGPIRQLTLDPVAGRPGEYRTLLPNDTAGRFEFRVQQPETGSLNYHVSLPAGHELEPSGLNEPQLRQLASDTGGNYYREEELHRLVPNVKRTFAHFTVHQEVLFGGPVTWVTVLTLLTVEWIVRKLVNLS